MDSGGRLDDDRGTAQRPPQSPGALETWLADRHHLAWRCEALIHSARLTGNHGRHRICSNDALLDTRTPPYPVGAASVKELFDLAGDPSGFAVGVKVAAGEGANTWYWYERRGIDPARPPLAYGVGVPDCAVCHGMAPARDYVFLRALDPPPPPAESPTRSVAPPRK